MHRHTLLLAGVAATSALVAPARLRVPPRATLQSHAAAAHPAMYRVVGESTRFVVSGAVATTLLVRRDAETLTWVAGAIAAAVGNKILKRIIGQARPEEGDDDGMPSSHACSVCHLGVGAALRFPLPPLALAGLTAYGLVALRWRVMNRYHTAAQVLVGGTYGAATALLFRGPARRLEAAVLPATIPLAWVLGIYAVGGVVVGSLERKAWLKKALSKRR
mmetsp:Transcript_9915/g.30583  ORF Transcript_9915/g.30583 Transcript_9915/m.30583 type:complete len:219 (-) Transcript_9915:43-699(-)